MKFHQAAFTAPLFFSLFFGNWSSQLVAQENLLLPGKDSSRTGFMDSAGIPGKPFFVPDSGMNEVRTARPVMVFRDDTLLRSPWGAVGRSFLVPGWGQWYNEQPVKSAVFLASDLGWIYLYRKRDVRVNQIERQRTIIDRQIRTDPYLNQEQRRILEQRFRNLTTRLDQALNRRNIYGWLFALSHLLGMVDAFVDAHLYGFHDKMEMAVMPVRDGAGISVRIGLY